MHVICQLVYGDRLSFATFDPALWANEGFLTQNSAQIIVARIWVELLCAPDLVHADSVSNAL